MKHNYIIFLPWAEYAEVMYSDLKDCDNVQLVYNPFKNIFLSNLFSKIYYITFYSRLRNIIPFKSFWNKIIYDKRVDNTEKTCFMFFMSDLIKTKSCLFQYLKNRYKGCKLIMYFEDIVSSRTWNGQRSVDFDTLNRYFDLVISYDRSDSNRYGFLYYPTPYSKVNIIPNNSLSRSDVFFCGLAKKRYQIIYDVFKKCCELNLKCDFIVGDMSDEDRNADGINKSLNKISYTEYLQHLDKTDCILEINQEGADGYSLRVWEALVYGKKLITNNKNILREDFYDPRQILYFEKPSDINNDFVRSDNQISPRYIDRLSPKNMIAFIDSNLSI